MKVVTLRVGIDSGCGCNQGLLFKNGTFEFVPISKYGADDQASKPNISQIRSFSHRIGDICYFFFIGSCHNHRTGTFSMMQEKTASANSSGVSRVGLLASRAMVGGALNVGLAWLERMQNANLITSEILAMDLWENSGAHRLFDISSGWPQVIIFFQFLLSLSARNL
jgi:hypothetical protein